MAWLNYHHLLYFWTVARSGTIAAASKELHLSQPTISTQLKQLEGSLGHNLFVKQGRKLALTDFGRLTFRYADDIFRLGRELQEAVERGPEGQQMRLTVGVAEVVPKLVAEALLAPAWDAVPDLQLECHEAPLPQLLSRLALHELDVVLSDQPAPADVKVHAFSHQLGDSGTSFFARPPRAVALKRDFPASLHAEPILLPLEGTSTRRQLEAWFEQHGLKPKMAGAFDDSALLKVFGARGRGVFTAPTVIEAEVVRQYEATVVGRTNEVRHSFYAISVDRKLSHPAVVAVAESARRELFD